MGWRYAFWKGLLCFVVSFFISVVCLMAWARITGTSLAAPSSRYLVLAFGLLGGFDSLSLLLIKRRLWGLLVGGTISGGMAGAWTFVFGFSASFLLVAVPLVLIVLFVLGLDVQLDD